MGADGDLGVHLGQPIDNLKKCRGRQRERWKLRRSRLRRMVTKNFA